MLDSLTTFGKLPFVYRLVMKRIFLLWAYLISLPGFGRSALAPESPLNRVGMFDHIYQP